MTGEASCSSKEHIGGGTTHCLKVVTMTLSGGRGGGCKTFTWSHFRQLFLFSGSDLHRSQPRWRCRPHPAQDSFQWSSPSRRRCCSSFGSPRGASRGTQGPSRRRSEPSEGPCQSPDSASSTSGSSPQSTAGLQKERRQQRCIIHRHLRWRSTVELFTIIKAQRFTKRCFKNKGQYQVS